ncbi:MAG: hypothetical protein QOC79_2949, partial [Actinomycetota bacterium]|nr:hypothetical protein [Actinomycetota bacterium]
RVEKRRIRIDYLRHETGSFADRLPTVGAVRDAEPIRHLPSGAPTGRTTAELSVAPAANHTMPAARRS